MRGFRMSWFFIVLFLGFTFRCPVEANHGMELVPAVVVGTVYCDTCFQEDFSKSSHFIPGASVAVECRDGNSRPSFRREVTTDKHGEFRVHLPFSVAKHVRKIRACSVKLIRSSKPNCALASMAASSSSLHLKSRKEGIHIFSAGFFTFQPQKQSNLCSQEPSLQNSRKPNSQKTSFPPTSDPTFPPPVEDPVMPDRPPLGQTRLPPPPLIPKLPPLPELPPLPPLPGVPNLPPMPGNAAETKPGDDKLTNPEFFFPTAPLFPPNPFRPPPFPLQQPPLFPPFPFRPPPLFPPFPFRPPPLFPPFPFQPPPLFPLPPNPLQQPPPAPLNPLPPNPLQPPQAPLNPLPPSAFQPPQAPLNPLPPSAFQPPSSPLIPSPPIPGLLTQQPPPPPPAFPLLLLPYPPLPFPPPGPGIPLTSSSAKTSLP